MLTLNWNAVILPGFIVFEGLDGAGTTTQAHELVRFLTDTGSQAEFTCEPTDYLTGTTIRQLLVGPEVAQPWTLALLFAADRHEHLERPGTGIRARCREGVTVVSDRYLFSSIAYQGAFVASAAVEQLNHGFPLPEHLIFIDTPQDEASRRLAGRGTRDTLEQNDVQVRVAARYRAVVDAFAQQSAMMVHTIDGTQSRERVFQDILQALQLETG
ncbi:MAG TPA: dTMP kinase [Alkalispirochaeta sp.]|nr:dTMP kinase [Alkalispirochaeta sp.]